MAENDSNTPIGVNSGDDTKTRKTVRLHPSGVTPPRISREGIADPLSSRDTDTSNLEILDDTQTRRTVKIKPLAPPTSTGTIKLPIEGEDTNTRRTVVLKPMAAAGSEGENTNTRRTVVLRPQTNTGEDTHTRRTVVLKPVDNTENSGAAEVSDETVAVPKPAAVPKIPVPINPAPAAEVSDETVAVPKPAAAPEIPVPINPVPAAEVSDETVAVPKPKPAVTPGVELGGAAEDDDRTVKVKRPVAPPRIGPRPMGAPMPKGGISGLPRPGVPGAKPAVPAPAATAAPAAPAATAVDPESIKETVKLPQPPRPPVGAKPAPVSTAKPAAPVAPVSPAAPVTPAVPAPPVAPPPAAGAGIPGGKPETVAEKDDDEITLKPSSKNRGGGDKGDATSENAAEDTKDDNVKLPRGPKQSGENTASPLYLVLGIVTVVLMLAVTALTLTQYLDFEHKVKIYEHVPALPHAK